MIHYKKRTLSDQIALNHKLSLVYFSFLVLMLSLLSMCIVGAYEHSLWLLGLVGGFVLGIAVTCYGWFRGNNLILKVAKAREASQEELKLVDNVAEEMAIAAGITKPNVYVIDDPALNAFATGTNPRNSAIVVTTGLIQNLNRDQLQAVVAHEMSHIRNHDVRLMMTLVLVAGLIPLLAEVFWRSRWYRIDKKSNKDSGHAAIIFLAIGLILVVVAPIFSKLLELAISRKREFMADASAAELTRYPEGLASALERISSQEMEFESASKSIEHMYIFNPFTVKRKFWARLFSTHPPVEERILALRNLMGAFPSSKEKVNH